jgi:proline dehydrogenase
MARRLAHRFVAGETLAEAIAVVKRTNKAGMSVSLDHLGENVASVEEARTGADDYIAALDAIALNDLNANISCKLTHLGLDLGDQPAEDLMTGVVASAAHREMFVRIDMEGSLYTQTTLDFTRRIYAELSHVGTVIQSYLYRSADDLRDLNRAGIRVRLVKGAYLEPPSIAYARKQDVDENYRRLAEMLLADGVLPAFATHDPSLIEWIRNQATAIGRPTAEFEFQMLYGIRRDLQRSLQAEGYRVRVYVPYGTQWYAYLMRRLAERPANLMFMVGNVAREAGR